MQNIQHYIDGEWFRESQGDFLDNHEPATGTVYGKIPCASPDTVHQAVTAAERAFPAWSMLPGARRSEYLHAIADAVNDELETLAGIESRDNGKPLQLARSVDIPRVVDNFRFFAGAAEHFASESHYQAGQAIHYTLRQPLGPVACISPWNLPLYLFSWKIAPALAAGNTVVAKPSEVTPASAYALAQICERVGLPPGVLNIIHGPGDPTGNALTKHPAIKAISFTGGTSTGQHIARQCAPGLTKLSLELGGKNPALVFADCDLEQVADQLVRSSFTNQGQICLCTSRILIESSVYTPLRDLLVERVKALRVGDPQNADTDQGALVSAAHLKKVRDAVDQAVQSGANVLTGGKQAQISGRCEAGYFYEPTLLDGLKQSSATNREEIFGPVATLIPFTDEHQAIEFANDPDYGLAACLYSRDVQRCARIAHHLKTGIVWINCWMVRDLRTPFGGMKSSGVGREGGWEAMRFFTEPKNVCLAYDHQLQGKES